MFAVVLSGRYLHCPLLEFEILKSMNFSLSSPYPYGTIPTEVSPADSVSNFVMPGLPSSMPVNGVSSFNSPRLHSQMPVHDASLYRPQFSTPLMHPMQFCSSDPSVGHCSVLSSVVPTGPNYVQSSTYLNPGPSLNGPSIDRNGTPVRITASPVYALSPMQFRQAQAQEVTFGSLDQSCQGPSVWHC